MKNQTLEKARDLIKCYKMNTLKKARDVLSAYKGTKLEKAVYKPVQQQSADGEPKEMAPQDESFISPKIPKRAAEIHNEPQPKKYTKPEHNDVPIATGGSKEIFAAGASARTGLSPTAAMKINEEAADQDPKYQQKLAHYGMFHDVGSTATAMDVSGRKGLPGHSAVLGDLNADPKHLQFITPQLIDIGHHAANSIQNFHPMATEEQQLNNKRAHLEKLKGIEAERLQNKFKESPGVYFQPGQVTSGTDAPQVKPDVFAHPPRTSTPNELEQQKIDNENRYSKLTDPAHQEYFAKHPHHLRGITQAHTLDKLHHLINPGYISSNLNDPQSMAQAKVRLIEARKEAYQGHPFPPKKEGSQTDYLNIGGNELALPGKFQTPTNKERAPFKVGIAEQADVLDFDPQYQPQLSPAYMQTMHPGAHAKEILNPDDVYNKTMANLKGHPTNSLIDALQEHFADKQYRYITHPHEFGGLRPAHPFSEEYLSQVPIVDLPNYMRENDTWFDTNVHQLPSRAAAKELSGKIINRGMKMSTPEERSEFQQLLDERNTHETAFRAHPEKNTRFHELLNTLTEKGMEALTPDEHQTLKGLRFLAAHRHEKGADEATNASVHAFETYKNNPNKALSEVDNEINKIKTGYKLKHEPVYFLTRGGVHFVQHRPEKEMFSPAVRDNLRFLSDLKKKIINDTKAKLNEKKANTEINQLPQKVA